MRHSNFRLIWKSNFNLARMLQESCSIQEKFVFVQSVMKNLIGQGKLEQYDQNDFAFIF